MTGETTDSERLARRCFALLARGETDQMLDLMHPEVEIVVRSIRPGEVLRGRDAVADFFAELSRHFFETHPDVFQPLDGQRIVVEGRMRWMDEERVLRDDPIVWALEFRDGLLFRSTPAQSVLEAEALLAVAQRDD
ncbi:MAG: nuclear transport factor 2 family protein [Gaiellaceae bacterium]